MSETSAQASVITDALEQLQNQQAQAEQQAEAIRQNLQKTQSDFMDEIAGMWTKKKNGPQYSPEVIEIANALQTQPMLLPAVQAFLKKLVLTLNEKQQEVLNSFMDESVQ